MKVLVSVVAYNEERNLPRALEDIRQHGGGYDVVVVDNGSLDGTAQVASRMGVPVIRHCINTGGSGGVVTTYFRYAYERGYDCLCSFDGDAQHLASELPKIIAPVERGEADYVIGSRFLQTEGFQSTALRRVGIRLFSYLDSALVGQHLTDVTSGFRAFNRRTIEFFARSYQVEIHDTNQPLLAAHFGGSRILEVPVVMRERLHGVSEFDFANATLYPLLGVVNILGVWLQHRQLRKAAG